MDAKALYDRSTSPRGPETDRGISLDSNNPHTEVINALRADGRTLEFIKDQYRHCKPILAVGASGQLLMACGIETALPDGQPDPGVITTPDASTAIEAFVAAIARHRHFARETDPPRV
jgi:catalase